MYQVYIVLEPSDPEKVLSYNGRNLRFLPYLLAGKPRFPCTLPFYLNIMYVVYIE